MNRIHPVLLLSASLLVPAFAKTNPFAGRWDIDITSPRGVYPDWMELVEKDGKTEVRVQPRGGSVHPAADVKVDGSKLTLTMNPAHGDSPATTWELSVAGDKLSGVQKRGTEESWPIAGVRAPELKRKMPRNWTTPEALFNGKDLSGWEPTSTTAKNNWIAKDGVLLNEAHGANLRSSRKFDDLKLHIEFNCPNDGNSGIYLRGRYEVQVEYEAVDANDKFHSIGSIYGMVAPSLMLPRRPGTWETFDIMLVGRHVSVARNGKTTIDNQEIPGITGGALDSKEGEPGPFYFQGDHTGGMMYRNITVSVPRK